MQELEAWWELFSEIPQDVCPSLESAVRDVTGEDYGGRLWLCQEEKKKSCQAKTVYKLLFTKTSSPKESPKALRGGEKTVRICFLQVEGRGRSQGFRRPLLPLAQSLPRCPIEWVT